MAYRTFETDKDGKLTIYPSLYGPRRKGICKSLKSLMKRIMALRGR
jgi:hypothetical protein